MINTNWKKDYDVDPNDPANIDFLILQDGSFLLSQGNNYLILQAALLQINTLWTKFVDAITSWGKDTNPATTWTPDQT